MGAAAFVVTGWAYAQPIWFKGRRHMAKTSPAAFVRQVRQEIGKVAWPTWKETRISTLMVFVMVLILSVFFLAVDGIFNWAIQFVLTLGS